MRTGRLLIKIYLGCVITVLVSTGLFFLFFTTFKSARQQEILQFSEHLIMDVAQQRHDPEALRHEVSRLKGFHSVHLSIYSPAGQLLASTISPPLPMIPEAELVRLKTKRYVKLSTLLFAHGVIENGQLVAVGIVAYRVPLSLQGFAPLITLLVLLMVFAIIFARDLARPLQGIASAAHRFGRGELSARTGVSRRDEIGSAATAFDEMADRVTRLMTSQQELLANVSHELRTPISRIQVAVDLLLDGISDQAKELLPEIAHDLSELERLIDDVLTVARLDLSRSQDRAAGVPLRIELSAIDDLLHKAAARFRAQQQTHELHVEVAAGFPEIPVDAVLLRRVVENLLDNARKYSEPGSSIRLSASQGASGVVIKVTDSGIGMDEADLKQLFTPFFRTDRSRSRTTGGVGLGLVLARRVVEAHGGTIDVTSAPGRGTTVTLDLPTDAMPSPRNSSKQS